MALYLETSSGFVPWAGEAIDDVRHALTIAQHWTATELAAIGLYNPAEADPVPAGKVVASTSVQRVEGVVSFVHVVEDAPPPPIPDRVTSRQFKLQLLAAGLLDDVEAWIATQDRAIQIAYETSGTFLRSEPMMQAGFAGLGFSPQQVDAFYLAAAEI